MATPCNIQDSDSKNTAKVTKFGQLITAPLDYSTPVEVDLDVINTAFNFIVPTAGHSIVITDIIASGNKDISPTDPANVEIYQADAVDELTANPTILKPKLGRGENLPLIGMNVLVPEGKWVNAKTDDNIVALTIMFYRVPAENI